MKAVLGVTAVACLAACTVERQQPNLVGQDIRLTIIHTSDIHSRLFPYNFVPNSFDQDYGLLPANAPFGGVARISTLAKRIRATSSRSLWLDSGDAFQGAPVFNEFKGEVEMRSLSLAGMEGEVLGNHEFDQGVPNLYSQISNWSQFPHLAANYAWDDPKDPGSPSLRDVVSPFEIYDVQGLRVAVIGMGNEDTLQSSYEGGNSLGFRPIDNNVALSQWVRILRPVSDLVVVVSHLGLDADEGLTASQVDDQNTSLPLQGVDLVLGGHLHIVTNPPKLLPNDDGSMYCKAHACNTLLIHSGAFAKYVGRIDLVVHVGENNGDPEKRSRIVSFAYKNIPVDKTIPDDPDVANLLWPYSIKLNQDINLNGVISYVHPPGTAKILRNDTTGGDSQLGNLVARSMQLQQGVEAQFAFTNSLGIRADFERGPLTIEQMFNVFPFENSITVMYLSGQEVQDTFDFVARKSASRGCRAQAQVAGIWFDMVCNGQCDAIDPSTGQKASACAKNIAIGENCRNGNPEGPIDFTKCQQLSPTGLYRVAVNDYIAAGGSGFVVLKRNTSAQNTGISLRDALQVYLNKQPTSCDGMTTDQIMDDTDPTKSVKQKYGNVSCLDDKIEAHDGRIRPVFE